MTTISPDARVSEALNGVRANWGWFVALGVGMIAAGLFASSNLFASTLASVFYIAAMMLAGALLQIVHAFTAANWRQRSVSVLSAILYGIAGAFLIHDPVLSALNVTLIAGAFMIAAGIVRVAIGVRERSHNGWGWMVASGITSLVVGGIIISTWEIVGLWFLGLVLSFDLVFQGCGFLGFGLSLRQKQR